MISSKLMSKSGSICVSSAQSFMKEPLWFFLFCLIILQRKPNDATSHEVCADWFVFVFCVSFHQRSLQIWQCGQLKCYSSDLVQGPLMLRCDRSLSVIPDGRQISIWKERECFQVIMSSVWSAILPWTALMWVGEGPTRAGLEDTEGLEVKDGNIVRENSLFDLSVGWTGYSSLIKPST